MVKWALASIPAVITLSVIVGFMMAVFFALVGEFGGLLHH